VGDTHGDLIAREAELIIKNARHTDFERDPIVDPTTQTYKLDAAAFVALVLERCALDHLNRIRSSDRLIAFPRTSLENPSVT
jgi:hypothetical protein